MHEPLEDSKAEPAFEDAPVNGLEVPALDTQEEIPAFLVPVDEESSLPTYPEVVPANQAQTQSVMSSATSKQIDLNHQEDSGSGIHLAAFLFEQTKTGFCCDVVLKVDGCELFAHREVLIAKCPFFSAMFTSGLEETRTGIVKLQNVTPSSVESLLMFLYIDRCDLNLENVWEIIHISHLYQVTNLFGICEKYLCDNVSIENYLDVAEIATQVESEKLRCAVADYISSDWEERKESCELSPLDICIFERIISSKDIQGCNDEEVASYILDWIAYDSKRIEYFKKLSENIPFKSLRRDFLLQVFLKHPIFVNRQDLVDYTLDRMMKEWEEFCLSDDHSVLLEFRAGAKGENLTPVLTDEEGESRSFAGCGYVGRVNLRVAEVHGEVIRFRIEGNFRFATGVPCRDVLFFIAIDSLRGSTAVIQKRFVHNLTQTVESPDLDIGALSWFTVYVKVFVN